MNTLLPCPSCQRHVRRDESGCPFCAAVLDPSAAAPQRLARSGPRLSRAASFAFGATVASLVACSEDPSIPIYGAPAPTGGGGTPAQQGGNGGVPAGGGQANNVGGSANGGAGGSANGGSANGGAGGSANGGAANGGSGGSAGGLSPGGAGAGDAQGGAAGEGGAPSDAGAGDSVQPVYGAPP